MHFKTGEVEEEDKDVDLNSSSSSDEDDHPDQEDDAAELMDVHVTEQTKVQTFYAETCKCKLSIGETACSATLILHNFTECRNNCNELSSAELDLVVLGIIHSLLTCNETSISGRVKKNRQNTRMCYFYHGKRICKKTFLFLHCLKSCRFHSLVKYYRKNELTLRTHGNSKRLPISSSSSEKKFLV